MLRPKKNSKKEFDNEKNTCDSKIVWRREREARNTQ